MIVSKMNAVTKKYFILLNFSKITNQINNEYFKILLEMQ